MPHPPFKAYVGDEPYVFVSYAHKDAETVYPELMWLHEQGLHIWYDEGVSPGRSWREELAEAIRDCSLFLLFLSRNAIESPNCQNELDFAEQNGSTLLVVHLEEIALPPGLAFVLGRKQAIMKNRLTETHYRQKLIEAVGESIQYRIRTRTGQTIVFVDIRRFTQLCHSLPVRALEKLLIRYDTLCRQVAREYEGEIWLIEGDACSFTFSNFAQAIEAILFLTKRWHEFIAENEIETALAIGMAAGEMMIFRSFIFGDDIIVAATAGDLARFYHRDQLQTNILIVDSIPDVDALTTTAVAASDFSADVAATYRHYIAGHRIAALKINPQIWEADGSGNP